MIIFIVSKDVSDTTKFETGIINNKEDTFIKSHKLSNFIFFLKYQ